MKHALSISFVYIGLCIGAGFASGREIFEYFNIPSQADFTGIIIAATGFGLLSYITMSLAKRFFVPDFDAFIEKISPKLAPVIKIFMALFMFCGFFVMLSAGGTLFESTLALPFGAGVFLLALCCFAVFAFDLKGIVVINTIMVPLMLLGMIVLCVSSIICGVPAFSFLGDIKNNFIISALCYVSYNTITAGSVLVPLSDTTDKRTLIRATILSAAILGFLIFLVWTTLNIYFNIIYSAEMPLLDLAAFYGDSCKATYAAVLFMALCTTAISHGFGILSKFRFKKSSDRIIVAALLCLIAMPFAKFGFSTLIAKLYSAFGFLGLFWTAIVIYRYMKMK